MCESSRFGKVVSISLHHFSDASAVGYSQRSYVRQVNDQGQVHCELLIGKCRVTPTKVITVFRLELTAAVMSLRVSNMIHREVEYQLDFESFWTDSTIVHGYISSSAKRYKTFVANRIQVIRNSTTPEHWKYVPTQSNPADDGSRGLSSSELLHNPRWLRGPDFLWQTQIPTFEYNVTDSDNDPEIRRENVDSAFLRCMLDQRQFCHGWNGFLAGTSCWRMVAYILRFKSRLLVKTRIHLLETSDKLLVNDISRAEVEVIKLVQHEVFETYSCCLHAEERTCIATP